EDRKKVLAFQTEVLKRKSQLLPMLEQLVRDKKYTFRAPIETIYDYSVMEYSFSFWQWGNDVKFIPSLQATDKEIFDHWQKISSVNYFDIESGKSTAPFFVQAHRQLGYYAYDPKPFRKVIQTKDMHGYIEKLFLEKDQVLPYDPTMSKLTDKYLKKDARHVLMIYGGVDPWSASSATKGKNPEVVKLVLPAGSHRSRISNMPEPMKERAVKQIKQWLELEN
ncbi:MAG: hypothetical protein LWW85_15790, partial [Marinilabiliales bacterium]|nr:hypothetical protein [Marinilabiliales bacterium]